MTEREEWIWLAGLLEGEGYFAATKRPCVRHRPRLLVQLRMTDRDVVEHAARLMGTSVHREAVQPNRKTMWRTMAYGLTAENAMRSVLPYMGTRRTAAIEQALATPDLVHHAAIERAHRSAKRCSACQAEKNLEEFHRDKTSLDGHGHTCKACCRALYAAKAAA